MAILVSVGPHAACGVSDGRTNADMRTEIERMYVEAERDFPAVESIEADELIAHRAASPAGPVSPAGLVAERIVLIDVRPEAERQVSIIPGAISVEDFEADRAVYAEATLITYCTVGARSGLFAAELQERGFEVLNLRGSLLAWAHAGGELVDADGPTNRLHVYGRRWDLAPETYETTW